MSRFIPVAIVTACVAAALFQSCGKTGNSAPAGAGDVPAAAARDVSYASDVQPILQRHCEECHLGNSHKGGFSLNTRDSALQSGKNGPRIVPGDSASSELIQHVTGVHGFKPMPPRGARLTPDEVGVLRAWIDQGVKYDADGATH